MSADPTAGLPADRPGAPLPTRNRPRLRRRDLAVRIGAIGAVVLLVTWANLYAAESDFVRELALALGYPGIFLGAAASGFNLVVPVPMIAFYPFFLEVGFHPVLTVLVIAAGMTTGDLVGYLLGRATREVMAPRLPGLVGRLEQLRARHGTLPFIVMFLYAAFAPIPNEVLVIPLAFMRYPLAGIFTAVLAGNLVFNSLVAFGVLTVFG